MFPNNQFVAAHCFFPALKNEHQAVYILGLIHLLIFYSHFELWTVFYPLAFEFSSILYLTSLKVYFEVSNNDHVDKSRSLPPVL